MNSKGSILIVDDELGARESLRMILKPKYDVHTAQDGKEAVNFIAQKKVDLVILDLNMPGLPGIKALQEIKKLKPEIEVIIVTGFDTGNDTQEAIGFGAGGFITKPFNVADIFSIVGKAFKRES